MTAFRTLNDIRVLAKSRNLIKKIYSISNEGSLGRDFGLRDQIRRASVSIASNIAEGFERDGNAEFLQYLSLAKGSLGEVRTQLQISFDVGYISKSVFDDLSAEIILIGCMLAKLMIYLRSSSAKGIKFYKGVNQKPGTRN